jgi:nucleoside-diphosphate-sugar epimerase
MAKTILITGGGGYIGSVMVGELLKKGYQVKVLDRMFFGLQTLEQYKGNKNFELIQNDTRYFNKSILKGVDTVIDLAGISNDPSCDLDTKITQSINYSGCVRTAKIAKAMGVERYIFSSSCSVYGAGKKEKLTEDTEKHPVSLYAKLKLAVEDEVLPLANDDFCVTVLRNATVYGISPRMRFDLVVNLMTMNAWRNKKIHVTGGGKQWRPNVHIKDVAKAFMLVMETEKVKVNGQVFNVGDNEQNRQVIQIAAMVRDIVPYVEVEVIPDDPDKRNYNVSFDKISKDLGYKAERSIHEGIVEIKQALENGVLDPDDIRVVTLKYYQYLLNAEKILKQITLKGKVF